MKIRVVMNWSGGKDSTLALHYLLNDNRYEVCGLLTSMSHQTDRVSMHGVSKKLMEEQAKSLNLPLTFAYYEESTYESYENAIEKAVKHFQSTRINHFAFGDIFLEDLKTYREKQFQNIGAQLIFPLWGKRTSALLREFLSLGYKTMVCSIDCKKMRASQLGQTIDKNWAESLKEGVDPCGENGEFHTYCYDGPLFENAIKIKSGKRLKKTYQHDGQLSQFEFIDLGLV